MMKQMFYSLAEIEALGPLKAAGKNWRATCPLCEKDHLSINKATGLYHCFTPDCPCDGILRDFQTKPSWSAEGNNKRAEIKDQRAKAVTPCTMPHATKPSSQARMLPRDYKSLPAKVLDVLQPLRPAQEPAQEAGLEQYLTAQKLSLATAQALRICTAQHRCYGEGDKDGRMCECIVYVNYVEGRPVNAKYRALDGKLFSQDSPTTPCAPYNIDCINPLLVEEERIGRLVIVEGEKDVMTVYEAGFRYVVSVPNGASSDVAKSFEAFTEWLEAVDEVVICGDNDLPGRTLQQHLIEYFGPRAYQAHLPGSCKDITEVMQEYGFESVREVITSAAPCHEQQFIRVSHIADAVLKRLHGDYDKGYDLGFGPLTNSVLRLTDQGGLIILTGKPNAGKTDFLNDVCAHMIFKNRKRVCMCSFEVPDKAAHIARMLQLAVGTQHLELLNQADIEPYLEVLNDRFILMDTDTIDPTVEYILTHAAYLHRHQPLHALVVDPYMFLNIGSASNETQAIRRMLTQFQQWGRREHVWVIIVAHPRKLNKLAGSNDLEKIDMYTIAGSANWANLADFILAISRVHDGDGMPALDYTQLDVLKVRDQDLCHTGSVLYRRQPTGRYDERPDKETLRAEVLGVPQPCDTMPWLL